MADRGRPRRDDDRTPRDRGDGRPRPRREGDRPSFGRQRGYGPRRDDRPSFDSGRRSDERRSYDRPRRDFDQPRRDFDRPERGFERPRRDFDQPERGFDRPRRDYERPRRDFERPRRDFERTRPDYDRPRRDDRPAGDDRPRGDRPRRTDREPFERSRPEDRRSFDRPRRDVVRPYDRPRGVPRRDGPPPESRRTDGRRGWQPRDQRPAGRPYAPRTQQAPTLDTSDLLGEDDELIAGRRPVEEAFAARREAIRLLIVPERRAALDQLVIHATTLRIPVVEVEGGSLTSLAGFDGHQGVALVARPRPPADVATILTAAASRNEPAFVLVLDSLEDPQNFGTLLRSAEAVGVHGVLYPTHRAAPLTPSAVKAAAGATEHLVLAAVDDLPGALADLHARGLRIAGAEEDSALSYAEADLRGPLALVVGSEGRGISAPVRRRLDLSVRIPMRGRIGSLNAAVAGSILLFAAAQQRPPSAQAIDESAGAPTGDAKPEPAAEAVAPPKAKRRRTKVEKAPEAPVDAEDILPSDC